MALPEGWRKCKLKEIAQTSSGGTPLRSDPAYYGGDIPWVKSGELNNKFIVSTEETLTQLGLKNSSAQLVPANSILVAMYGATAGKVAFLKVQASTNQAVCAVVPNKEILDADFVFNALTDLSSKLLKNVQGSGQPNLNQGMIADVLVLLPPLPEQQKIAEILGGVDAAIEATRELIGQTAKFKKAMMNNFLTRGLPGKHTRFQPTSLGQIPAEWIFAPLGSLFNLVERPIKMADDKEYQLVTVKRRNGGVVQRERLLGKKIKVKSQFEVKEGDFLISKRQIVHGACEIVPKNLSGAIISNEYNVLHAKDDLYLPYFRWVTRSQFMYRYFMASSVGVHIEKMLFKLDHWYKQKIPLPSLDEQKKITEMLENIERSAAANQDRLDQLKALKTSLMQVLLTGKVRVFAEDQSKSKVIRKKVVNA